MALWEEVEGISFKTVEPKPAITLEEHRSRIIISSEPLNDLPNNTPTKDATNDVDNSTESSSSNDSGDEANNQLQVVVYQGLADSTPLPREDEEPSRAVEVNDAPHSRTPNIEISCHEWQMVVSSSQVDPTIEEEVNLMPSPSSAKGENRDAPPSASYDNYEVTTTDRTWMSPSYPRPMSDTTSILSTLQLYNQFGKSLHLRSYSRATPQHISSGYHSTAQTCELQCPHVSPLSDHRGPGISCVNSSWKDFEIKLLSKAKSGYAGYCIPGSISELYCEDCYTLRYELNVWEPEVTSMMTQIFNSSPRISKKVQLQLLLHQYRRICFRRRVAGTPVEITQGEQVELSDHLLGSPLRHGIILPICLFRRGNQKQHKQKMPHYSLLG
nr:hypothetical protein Iba_chr08dCG12050 [Ipomoea batatas]